MECVRSGAALEQEVKARYLAVFFCGGAMLAPLFAFGHGVEFLLAKLEIGSERVRLELTADCEGNFMLPDREAAMAAMNRLFVVVHRLEKGGDETARPWTQLAPLRFEDRTHLDPTVPLPPDPSWDERGHQLVTGIWEWVPPPEHLFRFQVPFGEPIDTLLWRNTVGEEGKSATWRILISGDATDWFALAEEGKRRKFDWWKVAFVAVAAICFFWAAAKRRRG